MTLKRPTGFFGKFAEQANGLNARDADLKVERRFLHHERSNGQAGMNPFVIWLSLKALGGDIVRAIAALSRPSPRKGEVFPWTRTDGQAALTR